MATFVKTKPRWSAEKFYGFDDGFKVSAVLSDGQWYDAGKIKSLTRIREPGRTKTILDGLVAAGAALTAFNGVGSSYRMTLDQLRTWRAAHGVGLREQLIPGILYPRIFGSGEGMMTEAELFLSVPLRKVGFCTFTLAPSVNIDDVKRDIGYLGKFRKEESRKDDGAEPDYAGETYKIYCLASDCVRDKLRAYESRFGEQGSVFVKVSSFNMGRRRELTQFDQSAVANLIGFYTKFAVVLVPYLRKTLQAVNGESTSSNAKFVMTEEKESVIKSWIIIVIQRYDESSCIPFSVYVQQVLPRLAASYASNAIGGNVNKFQIEKNKAIKRIRKNTGNYDASTMFADDAILETMRESDYLIDGAEYRQLNSQLATWRQTKHPTALQWDETNEDKRLKTSVEYVGSTTSAIDDIERKHVIQSAIVHAGVSTGDYHSALLMLRIVSSRSLASALMSTVDTVPDEYKEALARELSSNGSRVGVMMADEDDIGSV